MALTRKALWSFLVGTLAALPVFRGVQEISAPVTHETAAPSEARAEATLPDPEARQTLDHSKARDQAEDVPAPSGAVFAFFNSRYLLRDADRASCAPAPDKNLFPLSRRALGRPRVRAPDASTAS
jgi:hypothetical protein